MKKFFYALMVFGALTFLSCSNSTNDGYATQETSSKSSSHDDYGYASQSSASSSSSSSSKSTTSNLEYVGTYKFQDFAGQKWKLVLKSDESAVLSLNGEEIDWGSWYKSSFDDYCSARFSWDFDAPKIQLESDNDTYSNIYIKEGYIYTMPTACEGNHPKKRLKYNFSK